MVFWPCTDASNWHRIIGMSCHVMSCHAMHNTRLHHYAKEPQLWTLYRIIAEMMQEQGGRDVSEVYKVLLMTLGA